MVSGFCLIDMIRLTYIWQDLIGFLVDQSARLGLCSWMLSTQMHCSAPCYVLTAVRRCRFMIAGNKAWGGGELSFGWIHSKFSLLKTSCQVCQPSLTFCFHLSPFMKALLSVCKIKITLLGWKLQLQAPPHRKQQYIVSMSNWETTSTLNKTALFIKWTWGKGWGKDWTSVWWTKWDCG